jgi:hypothetical protein
MEIDLGNRAGAPASATARPGIDARSRLSSLLMGGGIVDTHPPMSKRRAQRPGGAAEKRESLRRGSDMMARWVV